MPFLTRAATAVRERHACNRADCKWPRDPDRQDASPWSGGTSLASDQAGGRHEICRPDDLVLASAPFQASTAPAQPAQADPRPGFNLFSVQQDIEIGRQSAAQAERELPVIRDASLDSFLNGVIQRLVAVAPGARYPYRVRAVDSSDINAFTFPGGFLYVNRGLLAATRNESELAGVLAHEVSHVALRHGTHEASKAYGAQAGLGILGGLLGRGKSGTTQQIIQAIGGLA